jgi:hypothetical protein
MWMESMNTVSHWIELHPLLVAIMGIWTFIWKGFALWRSSELRQKYWFIAILLLNTVGILEIVYLFLVARNYKVEIVEVGE